MITIHIIYITYNAYNEDLFQNAINN